MTIIEKKTKNGTVYEVKVYLPTKLQALYNQQRVYKTFTTMKEAQKWERQKLKEIEQGYVEIYETEYFKEVAGLYLTSMKNVWSPQSMWTFIGYIKNYYIPHFNHCTMNKLTILDFKNFNNFIDNLDRSDKTKHNIMSFLRSFFKWAYKNNYLEENISNELSKYSQKTENVRDFLTIDELKIVAANIFPHDVADLVIFMAFTGMRIGEVCGLRFKDIDMNNAIITVSSQIHWVVGKYSLIPPKCGTISSIPLNTVAKNIIEKIYSKAPHTPEDFVFTDARGYPHRKDGYLKNKLEITIKRLQTQGKLNAEKNITFHSLRHTYASMLVHLNENIFTVQHLLRHKDFRLTYNTYAHMYPDKKPESFTKIDNEFGFLLNNEEILEIADEKSFDQK